MAVLPSHRCPAGALARAVPAILAFLFVVVPPASAQSAAPPDARAEVRPRADYMFGQPRYSFAFRGSWFVASAGSDIYDFVTKQLTIEKSAFNAPGVEFEFGFSVTPRLDVAVAFDTAFSSADSEYRDYIDNSGQPIEQTTSLRRVGFFGTAKYALTPRGRRVSRFAWVPAGVVPYVGGGGGLTKYDFKQTGDFVDFADLSVFSDTFQAEGWAPTAHALGGVDIRVYRHLYVNLEARYVWSSGDLGDDFVDFEPIDLSGVRIGGGIRVVF